MRESHAVAAAAVAAPLAGTFWWMLVDQISIGQAFSSPFPYLMLVLSWVVATPIYVVAYNWIAGKLGRLLLLATIGASPIALKAATYFLPPRSLFACFLIFSTAWVAAGTFWLVVRMAARDEVDEVT